MLGFGIEQAAIGTADAVRAECLLEFVGLEKDAEASDRALTDRRRCEGGERRPDVLLCLRGDFNPFPQEDRDDPVGGPGTLIGVVNAGQRLERYRGFRSFGQAAAEIVPVAAHGERCCADRTAEIESEDLAAEVTAELQRHEGEKHGFARPCWADDERVADITDMQRQPERGRTFGSAVKQRGRIEVIVPFRPRPHGGEGNHVGEIERRDRRLTHVCIDMAGQTAEPGVHRVHRLDHRREVAALDDLLDQPQFFVGKTRVGVPDRDRGGDIGHAGDVGAELLQGHVRVGGLVGGVGVHQHRLFVGHHLLEDRGNRLALGEPLPPNFGQQLGRVGLVEEDRTR